MLNDVSLFRVLEEARCVRLKVRFHQGWSWNTGQKITINYILRPLMALTPEGQTLAQQFRNVGNHDVVVYGNHALQDNLPSNYIFQSVSEFADGEHYLEPYDGRFFESVKRNGYRVVFDTQHYLEWALNAPFVDHIKKDGGFLTRMLIEAWHTHHHCIAEIHLCDFDPRLGSTKGRNVFPGTGILNLEAFCREVKMSKWEGIVTPEVKPDHLKSFGDMQRMKLYVEQLFA